MITSSKLVGSEMDDLEECKFLFLHATLGDSSKLFTVLCYHLKLNFRNLLRQHLRVFFCTFSDFLIFITIHSKRTCTQRLGLQFRLLNIPLFLGDVVFVMEKCDDGWFVGTSQRTGIFGTFPGNYVTQI